MIGTRRMDLTVDPPPDLAIVLCTHCVIEVDVTSKTGLDAYQALGVPELWRFEDGRLRISLLQNGQYQDVNASPHFPHRPIIDGISQYLDRSQTEGRSQTLKAFRQWVRALQKDLGDRSAESR